MQYLTPILIALITGCITLAGSFFAFRGDMTTARYERMEKLEADVTRLTAENVALQVEQALISAQQRYGHDIQPERVIFEFLEDFQVAAWCKRVERDAENVAFRMAYINSHYEQLFGVTKHRYIGITDFDVYPYELAERYHIHDLNVLDTKAWEIFSEPVMVDGERQQMRFVKMYHQTKNNNMSELICGWQVP
jgi:PAS domain-containing protein